MNNTIKIALVFILIFSSCRVSKIVPTPPSIVKVIKTEYNKTGNFIKSNEWMVTMFKDSESVIQYSDKEGGVIKGRYIEVRSGRYSMMTIKVRYSACRIEITPEGTFYSNTNQGIDERGYTPEVFKRNANETIVSYVKYMKEYTEEW